MLIAADGHDHTRPHTDIKGADSEGRQQVIYKHAISTIAPARVIGLREEAE